MKTLQKLVLVFNAIVLSLSCSAQVLSKTFELSVPVAEDIEIFVEGPKNFDIQAHGDVAISSEGGSYVVKGKDWKPIIEVDQDFIIDTWEKPEVVQIVEVSVAAMDPSKSVELLEKLTPMLNVDYSGRLMISCDLNISKFELKNGLLRRDRSTLILNDGSSYELKKLSFKTYLKVPKSNRLNLDLHFVRTTLGEHRGEVEADLTHGSLKAKSLSKLQAKIIFSSLDIKNVDQLDLESISGQINVGEARIMNGKSQISKFVLGKIDELRLSNSENDRIVLKAVERLVVESSTFTDFQVTDLGKELEIHAKSGDIQVNSVASDFDKISISNLFSTINLGLSLADNYTIEHNQNVFSTYSFPPDVEKQKSTEHRSFYRKGNAIEAGIIVLNCESCKVFYDY